MFRTPTMAALALALLSSAAMAQSSPSTQPGGPPAQLSRDSASSYGDNDPGYDDRDDGPPPSSAQAQGGGQQAQAQSQDERAHDMYCRRDAAARTGYVTPGEAAHDAKTSSQVGGTLGGAALGAIIGGASHAAGAGALIGAGAGLIAGTAIGSDNAHHAASDVEHAYSDAYYACMDEADDRGPPQGQYAYGPPPPPAYYGAPYPYYYPPYYGPSVSFGFYGGGYRGWHGGRGFHHR